MKRIHFVILIIITLFALVLRFYQLGTIPFGFHIDEAIIADNANFILHTGRDTNNAFLPLQTEVFGDYNPTGYAYLAILPIKIFGLNEFATRFPGALLNSLAVLACFFLIYALFENISLSLLTAFLFSVSPWSIVLSRSSEETVASFFFVVLGFAFLFYSIRKEQIRYLVIATLLLIMSYFMYFTPRIFVPIFFFTFFLPVGYWWRRRNKLFSKLFFCSFIILGLISFFLLIGIPGGTNRFNQVSIFGYPGINLVKAERIREDGFMHTPVVLTRLYNNKFTAYSYTFFTNYLQYFSSDFLFMKGGLPLWFSVPEMGLVYLIELPFILFGVYKLFRERKKWSFTLFAWILLVPAISAVTIDDVPNVRRAMLMIPIIELFAAYGVFSFFKALSQNIRTIFIVTISVLFLFNIFYFLDAYFVHAPIHQNWYRNDGFEKLIKTIGTDYNSSNRIIVTKNNGSMYGEILFYMHYDPAIYLREGATKDTEYTGFGKFFFVPQACPSITKDDRFPQGKNIIYINRGDCPVDKSLYVKKENIILRKDGTKAFRMIYE